MLLASLLFAIMKAFVKVLDHIPAIELVFFRSVISLVLSLAILKREKVPFLGNNRKMLFLRGFFGMIALTLFFSTLQVLPLASASLIFYIGPLTTALFAMIFLKEKVYPIQWLFFLISIVGIGMMKGFDTRISLFFLVLGIIAAICSSAAYTTISYLKKTEHPVVIVLYFPLVSLPIAALISVFTWVTPTGWDWFYIIGIGILTQAAQVLMTKAYQQEEASRVAGVSYAGVLYSLLFGIIFFGETFNFWASVGMGLVVVGVLLNISIKQFLKKKKPQQKPMKVLA